MTSESDNPFSAVLSTIPGYRGYRSKEDRRDADRRVRDQVAAALDELADRVETVARSLAEQRQITAVGPVDEFAKSLRNLISRISTASYGYGGLFSDRNVDEHALDQLRQFDESLLKDVDGIKAVIEKLEQAYSTGSGLTEATKAGTEAARQLNRRFETRGEVIETAKPAAPESVLAVISPAETAPLPIYNLHEHDALSISGENYVVDGRIDVEAGADSFRLFRIDEELTLWLLAPATASGKVALVNEKDVGGQDEIESTLASSEGNSEGSGTGSVIAGGKKVESRSVAFSFGGDSTSFRVALDWSGERQIFEGKEIEVDEIEVYPAAS
jgi:hypothetical protein